MYTKQNIREDMITHKYEIDMLDVDDADAFLIRFYDESDTPYIILVDGGRYTDGEKVHKFIRQQYNTYTIDLAICTHCDDDHYGGLLWLVENMKDNPRSSVDIKELWVNDPGLHSWANDYERRRSDAVVQKQARSVYTLQNGKNLLTTIEELKNSNNANKGMLVKEIFSDQGDYSAFEGIIEVIGPSLSYYEEKVLNFRHSMKSNKTTSSANDSDDDDTISIDDAGSVNSKTLDEATPDDNQHNLSSIIFLFKPSNGKKYLFTGDAGEESFEKLAYESDWNRLKNIDWLKLPHHGSKRNITCSMINHFRPKIVYGTSKCYGTWVSKAVINAFKQVGAYVYLTNVNGSMWSQMGTAEREGYSTAKPV